MPLANCDGSGLYILVVEGDRDSAASLARLLRFYGHRVQVASDAAAAYQAAHRRRPDVVLLDLALPGMDRCDVARRFQEPRGEKKPLLIALTGYSTEADCRRSRETGIDLHLRKPVDLGFLRRVLARFSRIIRPS
jgi:two-component system CheB/CheR fusion protein